MGKPRHFMLTCVLNSWIITIRVRSSIPISLIKLYVVAFDRCRIVRCSILRLAYSTPYMTCFSYMQQFGAIKSFVQNVVPLRNNDKFVDITLIFWERNGSLEFLFFREWCELMLIVNNVTSLHVAAVCCSVDIGNLLLSNLHLFSWPTECKIPPYVPTACDILIATKASV